MPKFPGSEFTSAKAPLTAAAQLAKVAKIRVRCGPGKEIWLVGQGHPSEKYEFVNWDD